MNDRSKKSNATFRPEGLETRSLLATGIAAIGLAVVEDLGVISRAQAIQGVEVTASIASHGSVKFRFDAGSPGDYLLKVRHVGDGLTIEEEAPSGSSSIDPGPSGPSSTIALPLKAAEYEITASAVGDRPVSVDWELLLESGVGQSAAKGATLSAPSVGLPPASTASTTAAPSASPSGAPSNFAENWGGAVTPSMVATAGPIGRVGAARAIAPVGPTSPQGELAMAFAGDGLPAEVLAALGSGKPGTEESTSIDPTLPATPLLTLETLGDARQDQEALGGASSWLERLAVARDGAMVGPAAMPTAPGSPDPKADPDEVGRLALASAEEVSVRPTLSAASSGLVAGGVILALAFRKRPGFLARPKSRPSAPWSEARRHSMG